MDTLKLEATARQMRQEIIKMITAAGSGHPGGSLSAADIMTVLYFDKMNLRPDEPKWDG
ncbi:MAG: transketolase, partial [Firmicutes bacterium]|nr:transketolase [Bacillota bacterium]